ncbi:GAF domain-containing protein [Nocardia camponoti]|uniref:Rv3651-like N-terminal domain-containing protein n=1 Tax=Nocardia camponoti TaxID=1616106 RepID=A0A917QLZ4_9NOCA|nr:GAF domain-containing protein [Nocardia camponoti]GGK57267.1 hypothetical protein GCM10011591_31760 [Nocardia camponoti]
MIIARWQLVETLGAPDTWSILASGTEPRDWTSYQRAVPARLQRIVAAAYESGQPVEVILPKSRHPWSELRMRAVPVGWPGEPTLAVRVGVGDVADDLPAAPFLVNSRTRIVQTLPEGLGPHFSTGLVEFRGAEPFERVERFDGDLDFLATLGRSTPNSRWSGIATVYSAIGPRSLLIATRNGPDRYSWRGLVIDVTDSVAPQQKSFEAATLDLLRATQPDLYLLILDTAQLRQVRWVSEPVPNLRWRGVDEREMVHPDDRARVAEIRTRILNGDKRAGVRDLRLSTESGGWLTADVEVSPLPGGGRDDIPAFVLAQVQVTG